MIFFVFLLSWTKKPIPIHKNPQNDNLQNEACYFELDLKATNSRIYILLGFYILHVFLAKKQPNFTKSMK